MTDARPFRPDWVSVPGDTIADLLEERAWSQQDLATRCLVHRHRGHVLPPQNVAAQDSGGTVTHPSVPTPRGEFPG